MKSTLLRILNLIKKGELRFMVKGITKRILSKTEAFGLKRDLTIEFEVPNAQIDLLIRSYKASDEMHFVADLQNDGLMEADIPTCYVATNTEDAPCYRQWLMGSEQNESIKAFWGQSFPELKVDEALVESVFTIPAYRRKGIMPAALDRISQKANGLGLRYVILFVELNNLPSLKGCHRSGFSPYVLRTERWFLFRRTIKFESVPKALMAAYLEDVRCSK
ncbi:GNAT family N-acetyltransferase [uncultured Winogradskyella sp.]|uniref:GNAT family N-acetyltransferase n=1 Tax=uncultured Winogradskyella sp. TaxID=395353 RepID=UPI00261CCC52|nr:GNAT family N-acetyltransferase [uncultured Winogradskyella sp.]